MLLEVSLIVIAIGPPYFLLETTHDLDKSNLRAVDNESQMEGNRENREKLERGYR